jgi:hypothetical protein
MDLPGLKNILKKLQVLNNNRMAVIRDSFVTTEADSAEYEERFRERNWYDMAVMEIDRQLSGLHLEKLTLTRDELQLKIQNRLEFRYNEVIDKIRQTGAGIMVEDEKLGFYPFSTPSLEETDGSFAGMEARMKEVKDDEDFLRSCGIEGEIW